MYQFYLFVGLLGAVLKCLVLSGIIRFRIWYHFPFAGVATRVGTAFLGVGDDNPENRGKAVADNGCNCTVIGFDRVEEYRIKCELYGLAFKYQELLPHEQQKYGWGGSHSSRTEFSVK